MQSVRPQELTVYNMQYGEGDEQSPERREELP